MKRITQLEGDLKKYEYENGNQLVEINKLTEDIMNKDKTIHSLSLDFSTKEEQMMARINEIQIKLEEKNIMCQNLLERNEKLDKELMEIKSKESFTKFTDVTGITTKLEISKKEFLEKKFTCAKYDEKYIIKCLQRDILDFQEYTKEQIRRVKATQEELVRLIQESVNECMSDYEVRLYGSHATNLCLQWSDLDVVLIHKRNYNVSSHNALQGLYINLLVYKIINNFLGKNLEKVYQAH